jgi:hypothetical protein
MITGRKKIVVALAVARACYSCSENTKLEGSWIFPFSMATRDEEGGRRTQKPDEGGGCSWVVGCEVAVEMMVS